MSGGRYNYAFTKINVFVEKMTGENSEDNSVIVTPRRKAFADHLLLVSEAMRAIEWVDSGDSIDGAEDAAIAACLPSLSEHAETTQEERRRLSADADRLAKKIKSLELEIEMMELNCDCEGPSA